VIYYALALTHVLWATSSLLDPLQYVGKPVNPVVFALIHIAIGLAILSRYRAYGGWLSVIVLTYYWLFVKPRAPIAEPQSVGILLISLILVFPELQRVLRAEMLREVLPLAVRLGLAYPFLEWGLDALRNPLHFQDYLRYENALTQSFFSGSNIQTALLVLGLFEVVVAVWLAVGLTTRIASFVSLAALIVFSVVAGYPLALPQDIALGGAAYHLMSSRPSKFSTDHVLKRSLSSYS
jgi:uncharacterized membrane protein YphA (DoxX/SURF4 family)